MSLFADRDVRFDVCVVGAGVSGLRSAMLLSRAGCTVCVLEARDRVGGRTLSHTYHGGGTFDLGGQWLGPKQTRMNALVAELGLMTVSQEWFVSMSIDKDNPIVRSGAETKVTELKSTEFENAIKSMEHIMENLTQPLPGGQDTDSVTVGEYVRDILHVDEKIQREVDLFVCNSLACTSNQVSLHTFLSFVRACGGFHEIGDGRKGAQNHTILGGAQSVSVYMAKQVAEMRGCEVRVASPVTRIIQKPGHVVVQVNGIEPIIARRVIVALAPTLWKHIDFSPELSSKKLSLSSNMRNGKVIKVVSVYRDIFWEVNRPQETVSGQQSRFDTYLEKGPVRNLFPTHIGSFPALVGLITAEQAEELRNASNDEIKNKVVEQYTHVFDSHDASKLLLDFYSIDWGQEQFSGGCFEALPVPGYGRSLFTDGPRSEGRLHFTCSEFGKEWPGYMEGAVSSAERVAEEVQHELGLLRLM